MADRTRNKRTRDDPSSFPPEIVCTSKAAHGRNNAIELGAVFSLVVVGLYFFAIFESAANLPELSTKRNPHNLFGNLNMAKLQESHRALKAVAYTGGAHNTAPPATWPVNFKNEINNVETILHPGDQVTKMTVPKFWSPPLHNRELYTREQAMSVGTCVEADASGNHVRGDDCPLHQRTIFIAIASYRDFQCRRTIESAFTRAQYPERIRVGVVDQIINGEDVVCNDPIEPCDENPNQALCKYQDQIDVYEMPAQLSVGPVVARHIGDRLYRGEYYATQSDAHVSFTEKWDSDIISQMEATHNEMAVLTTYLTDVQGSIGPKGNSLRSTRPIMCNTYYEGGPQGLHLRHGSQPERPPSIHGSPQLAPWWAAGYSFSRGHFVVNVAYDLYQPMIFQGEEMSIGIRGWTVGYDFYAPERSVCFHHYAVGKNAKIRNKVKHFWENSDRYAGTGRRAMARLLGIVHMNPEVDPSKWDHTEEDIYGLGGVRTPEKFYTLFGIDVVQKKTQGHLCMLVDEGQGKMHKLFTPKLRADGMGIDYDQITYRWKDPRPDQKQPR
ncbi:MAG: hypothetical protein SGBAC_010364 [Bacillariaceae sp.]